MKKYLFYYAHMLLISMVCVLVWACNSEKVTDTDSIPQGIAIRFKVEGVQQPTDSKQKQHKQQFTSTQQKVSHNRVRRIETASNEWKNLTLIETTTKRNEDVNNPNGSRAAIISDDNLGDFASYGFRSSSKDGKYETWFKHIKTSKKGELLESTYKHEDEEGNQKNEPLTWDKQKPWAKFLAIYPQEQRVIALDADYPYVQFNVKEKAQEQVDLLTAYTDVIHYDENTKIAPLPKLKFWHALTAIKFEVGEGLPETTINKIEIKDAKGEGNYFFIKSYNGDQCPIWKDMDDKRPKTFVLDNVTIDIKNAPNKMLTTGTNGDNNVFYLIPQDTKDVEFVVHFGKDKEGNDLKPVSFKPEKVTWEPNTTVTYTLTEKWEDILLVRKNKVKLKQNKTDAQVQVGSVKYIVDGRTKPIAWQIVGYCTQKNGDTYTKEKPSWIESISPTSGKGGVKKETINIKLTKCGKREKRYVKVKLKQTGEGSAEFCFEIIQPDRR